MQRGRPEDVVADEETEYVARQVADSLQGKVAATHVVGVWDNLRSALRPFDPKRVVVFNLIESLGGKAYTDFMAPRALHRLGFRFTGAPSEALRLSGNKLLAKKVFESNGLPTPRYQVVRKAGARRFDVPLPAIVKPVQEGGSLGITQEAIVHDRQALSERVRFILETYRQPVLIEEYIAGRELNVAIWGGNEPQLLPISEIDFQWTDDPYRKIVSFASKWERESVEYNQTPGICPATLSASQRKRVETAALKAYRLLGVRGYCRVDVRLREGTPYLLEVNANPDLASEAGFFRSARTAGYTYESMVARILEFSLERPAPALAPARGPVQLALKLAPAA
jgi:D-alanine-D-alanine ligase